MSNADYLASLQGGTSLKPPPFRLTCESVELEGDKERAIQHQQTVKERPGEHVLQKLERQYREQQKTQPAKESIKPFDFKTVTSTSLDDLSKKDPDTHEPTAENVNKINLDQETGERTCNTFPKQVDATGQNLESSGFFKTIKGIRNLGKAAKQSPDEFKGQLSTELLGMDVTQPLPNERLQAPKEKQLLDKQGYQPADFDQPITRNLQLSPELAGELAELGDGGYEFGEQQDPGLGIEALKEEIKQQPESSLSPEKTNDGLVGPFSSVRERSRHLLSSMTSGVGEWWGKNKFKVIAVVVAGIVGLIAANILSGGAVMAALPLLMKIVGGYFAGEAVYGMAKHFGGYLAASWPGSITKGAKNLARAFALGAVELVFALLFGGKAAVKGLRAVTKTAQKGGIKGISKMGGKAARETINSGIKTAKNLGTVAKKGAKNTVKNGKFAMQGIKRGALKEVKSLDEAGQHLGKRLKFTKFKMQVKNGRFKLLGKINPWQILASGRITEYSGSRQEVGNTVFKKGDRNPRFIIGVVAAQSSAVKDLRNLPLKERKALYNSLNGKSKEEMRSILLAARATRENARLLRKAMIISGKKANPGDHAHHIILSTHRKAAKARDVLKKFGIPINGAENGVFISETLHSKLHSSKYIEKVTALLKKAKNAREARHILKLIESQILIGKFP